VGEDSQDSDGGNDVVHDGGGDGVDDFSILSIFTTFLFVVERATDEQPL
jgi:hypothetical protein